MKYYSAGTKYPNTPESDRQPKVWHTVRAMGDDDGRWYETDVYASDPQAAIEQSQYRAPEMWTPVADKEHQPD